MSNDKTFNEGGEGNIGGGEMDMGALLADPSVRDALGGAFQRWLDRKKVAGGQEEAPLVAAPSETGTCGEGVSGPVVDLFEDCDDGGRVTSVASSVGSADSWADMMDDVDREKKESKVVEMPEKDGGVGATDESLREIKFGSLELYHSPAPRLEGPEGTRFFRDYVRTSNVKAFVRFLEGGLRFRLPKVAIEEMALVTFTTATVPTAFVNGSARIRTFASIGDAVLTCILMLKMESQGSGVASMQHSRERYLSNAHMSGVFVRSGLVKYVSTPQGINVATSKTGADVIEAIAGVLAKRCGLAGVQQYARFIKLMN